MEKDFVAGPNGRYFLDEEIGRGGVGEVFRAHDTQLHRFVAIKRLHCQDLAAPERAEKTIVEARHLAALQHPNIVTVYDFIESQGDVLVVMELLRGRTLEQVVETAPLTSKDFVEVMRQTLAGLQAAHDMGMLHRDIKPTNIMLMDQKDGAFQIKILDFGLAKITAAPSLQSADIDGGVLGSIFFMSPEQLENTPLDARSDLYALGCVGYFLLTTQYPFRGDTIQDVICSHLQGRMVPLSQLRPDLPPLIVEWVQRMLAVKSHERPASAEEASQHLKAAAAGKFTRPVPVPIVPPLKNPKTRRMLAIGGGTALVLFFAVGSPIIWPHYFKASEQQSLAAQAPLVGLVESLGMSDEGNRFLSVTSPEGEKLTLVFSSKTFAEAQLAALVGKTIRLTGQTPPKDGMVTVESFSQIETI